MSATEDELRAARAAVRAESGRAAIVVESGRRIGESALEEQAMPRRDDMRRDVPDEVSILGSDLDLTIDRALSRAPDRHIALASVLSLAREVLDVAAIAVVAIDARRAQARRVHVVGPHLERSFPLRWSARSRDPAGDACRALACEIGVAIGSDGPFDAFLPSAAPRPLVCAALGERTLAGLVVIEAMGRPRRAHLELADVLRRPLTAWLARVGGQVSAPSTARWLVGVR